MDRIILLDLAKRFWKPLLLIGLLVIIYFQFNKTTRLEAQVEEQIKRANEHRVKANFYKNIYNELMEQDNELSIKYDSLVIEKNKIKIIHNEKIKLVDKYTVSDMQYYFDERTK
jgi:hypothetical protein